MFFQLDDTNQNNPIKIVHPAISQLPLVPMTTLAPLPAPMAQPISNQPELEILATQVLPRNSVPLYYNGTDWSNGQYLSLPENFEIFNSQGERIPPYGYSFVKMYVPGYESPRAPSPQPAPNVSLPESPQMIPRDHYHNDSHYSQASSSNLEPPSPNQGPVSSRASSVEPIVQLDSEKEKPKNRKFRHRSKQERIQQVHEELRLKYTAMGLYAGNDEVLRGFDTVRVHVKTYHALSKIHLPLEDVENHPRVTIHKIATPFSMKNKFQKKGFIVYLKLKDRDMVPYVKDIFAKYKEHFNKCDLALKKEDKIAMQQQEAARLEEEAKLKRNVILPRIPPGFGYEEEEKDDFNPMGELWRPSMLKRRSSQAA